MSYPLTRDNVMKFFELRKPFVSAALIADTRGLDTTKAQAIIDELVTEGKLIREPNGYRVEG